MGYQLWTPGKLSPFFSLFVSGYELGDALKRYVESVNVAHRYQEALTTKIIIRDEKLQWVDLDIFNKGTEWIVTLGSPGDFRAFGPQEVAGYRMTFGTDGICRIELDLMDKMRVLNSCVRARSWSGKTIGQVVQQIAEENGLGFFIEDGDKFKFDDSFPAMQADWTDARFLRKIADRFGYYFAVQDGSITFKQNQVNTDVENPKILAWRVGTKSLMSFTPAQTTFIKKGGGSGSTGASGSQYSTCNVDIPSGSAPGTSNTDDVYGQSDPNDMTVDDAVSALGGGAEELAESGDLYPTSDNSDGDRSAVTDPSTDRQYWQETPAPETWQKKVLRFSSQALRDVADTPGNASDTEKVAPAAAAGTKSDVAMATAELTVYDVLVRQGDPVEVIGVGRRFSGRWRILEFEHNLDSTGLHTKLGCAKKGLGPSSKTEAAEDAAAASAGDATARGEEGWVAPAAEYTLATREGSGILTIEKQKSNKP